MRELVDEDHKLIRKEYPLEEAIQYFKEQGYKDKVSLLKHRRKDHLILYSLDDYRDYHHGYMVPSTGYLKWFGLSQIEDGFIVRFPRRHKPTELLPLPDYLILIDTFRQYGDWLSSMGIDSIGALDDSIQDGRIREIIMVSEALHEQRIAEIAGVIAKKINEIRVINRRTIIIRKDHLFKKTIHPAARQGNFTFTLEMDSYFVDRDETPVDENGELDFKSIDAVDRKRLGEDIQQSIEGYPVQLPHFDFVSGQGETGEWVQLHPGQIMILEGIHGLNPELVPNVPGNRTFRIYASALTQLNLDRHNRVSTTDTRLIRRIVRDARDRGYSAQDTIKRWEICTPGRKTLHFPLPASRKCDVQFCSCI